MRNTLLMICTLTALWILSSSTTKAIPWTYDWTNDDGNSNWADPDNWDSDFFAPAGPPDDDDTALFDKLLTNTTVNVPDGMRPGYLWVANDASVSLNIIGTLNVLENPVDDAKEWEDTLLIGYQPSHNAAVNLLTGRLNSKWTRIGVGGGHGTMTVSGGAMAEPDNLDVGDWEGSFADGEPLWGNSSGTLTLTNSGTQLLFRPPVGFPFNIRVGVGALNTSGEVRVMDNAKLAQSFPDTHSGNFVLGDDGGTGKLFVESGGIVELNADFFIGGGEHPSSIGDASEGLVTVHGSGSRLATFRSIRVGEEGIGVGTFKVQSGAAASTTQNFVVGHKDSASGTVTVEGSGSTLTVDNGMFVAGGSGLAGGTGLLQVQDSGTLTIASPLKVWSGGTLQLRTSGRINTGSIDVEGSLLWTGGTLDVRKSQVTIESGAQANLGTNSLTVGSGQQLLVSDANNNVSNLSIGDNTTGTLNLQNGGTVTAGLVQLGRRVGSNGMVTVEGTGSTLTSRSSLSVGGSIAPNGVGTSGGLATLTVRTGGKVDVANKLQTWLGGTVHLEGGRIETESFVNSAGTFTHDDGLLTVDGGTFSPVATGNNYIIDGAPGKTPVVSLSSGATGGVAPTELRVGNSNNGVLNIGSGAQMTVAGDAYVAFFNQGNGSINLDGPNSKLTVQGDLEVGDGNTGSLTIVAGSEVDSSAVGSSGHDRLGDDSGSQGTAFISGVGSIWKTDRLLVGGNGLGQMTIANGGKVSTSGGNARIAVNAGSDGSRVTVEDVNSIWELTGNTDLLVGDANGETGYLELKSGGQVNSHDQISIGFNGTAIGNATVDGLVSKLKADTRLTLGQHDQASGRLTASNSGVVESPLGVIGNNDTLSPNSTLRVQDGTAFMQFANELQVRKSGVVQIVNNDGTIQVGNGTLVTPGGLEITSGGKLSGGGFVDTLTTNSAGTVAPGQSAGSLTVREFVQGAAGTLEIELGGTSSVTYDFLTILDTATLGGTLDVSLINGFTPVAGDMFEILSASSFVNEFDVENLPTLAGLDWLVDYQPTQVSLNVINAPAGNGDFDMDGDTDGADFLVWQRGYPGTYDASDLGDWEANYGAVTLAASTTVPEPTSCLLLLLMTIAILGFRVHIRPSLSRQFYIATRIAN